MLRMVCPERLSERACVPSSEQVRGYGYRGVREGKKGTARRRGGLGRTVLFIFS